MDKISYGMYQKQNSEDGSYEAQSLITFDVELVDRETEIQDNDQQIKNRQSILQRRRQFVRAVHSINPSFPQATRPTCSHSVLKGAADSAVLADAPEMNGNEQGCSERHGHAVQNIEAQERCFAHGFAAQEQETRIGAGVYEWHVTNLQESGPWAFITDERMGSSHVATNRDGPDSQLIPRQQVPGETQEEGKHQKYDTNTPVEFAGRFIAARQEDPIHVQPDGDHHGVSPPAMELT